MESNRKLYKIEYNKKICGVCGGIGEYLKVDPTVIRIIWALLVCFGGCGIVLYIICAFIMPNKSDIYPDIMN